MSWRSHKETEPRSTDNWRGGSDARRGDDCDEQREAERPLQLPKLVDGNHLMVRSSSLFKGGPRALKAPEVVGFYSVDSEKKVHCDDSAMSVLSEKYIPRENERMQVELDLNKGKDQFKEFTTTTTDIFRQFLQWILKNQKELTDENSPNKLMADIVVARVILQAIMEAPYAGSHQFAMMLFAQYFKGSIYIDYPAYEDDDEEEEEEEVEVDPIISVYGHKFEQYMTGGDPNEVIHCNRQFRCVLKQHLNELTILQQATTDAIDRSCHQDNFKDMSSFVSLKACLEHFNPHKLKTIRKYTFLKWWSGNQLVGIPRVLKGTRNYDGILHTLEMLQTADLPDMAEGEWEPSVCINFLAKFLNFVKEKVLSEPDRIHCFLRSPSAGHCFLHYYGGTGTEILPEWYTQNLFVSEEASRGGNRDSRRSGANNQFKPVLVDGNHLAVLSTPGGPRSLEVPHVLGSYSIDRELNIQFDDSMMCVLSKEYIPRDNKCLQVELDLNIGRDQVHGYTGTAAHSYNQLLQWIIKNQKKLKAKGSSNKLMADFVCSRGVLRNLMNAPYAGFGIGNMTMIAKYFRGTIYLAYQHSAQEEQDKKKIDDFEIYGHKFEQYMTGGDPHQDVECNCQFRCVVKQQLNDLTLMYSICAHAIDQTRHQENFTDMRSFVSLRAVKEFNEPFKKRNYKRYTLLKWWNESQLSGIPRVLKGTRNYDGILHTLEMLQTADLPDMAEGEWEPSVCINFLAKFLNFVKEKVLSEPDQIHHFYKSNSAHHYFFHDLDTSESSILPNWYTNQLFVPEEENSD